MLTRSELVILYLSISLSVMQWVYLKEARRLAYLEGRQSVFTEQSTIDTPENTCIAPGGKKCNNGRG